MKEAVAREMGCQLLGEEARAGSWMAVVVEVLQQVPLAGEVEEGQSPAPGHLLQTVEEEEEEVQGLGLV